MRSGRHLPLALTFLAGLVTGTALQRYPMQAASAAPERITADEQAQTVPPPKLPLGTYAAEILHVIDGDTVEARVAVWMGQDIVTKVRLRGIDAPEIKGACGQERDRAVAARDALVRLAQGHAMRLTEIGPDKYFGRVVARLSDSSGRDAGAALMQAGLARPYEGRRRDGWCALP
jgi:endonuclease YncB( thermonuclease family)